MTTGKTIQTTGLRHNTTLSSPINKSSPMISTSIPLSSPTISTSIPLASNKPSPTLSTNNSTDLINILFGKPPSPSSEPNHQPRQVVNRNQQNVSTSTDSPNHDTLSGPIRPNRRRLDLSTRNTPLDTAMPPTRLSNLSSNSPDLTQSPNSLSNSSSRVGNENKRILSTTGVQHKTTNATTSGVHVNQGSNQRKITKNVTIINGKNRESMQIKLDVTRASGSHIMNKMAEQIGAQGRIKVTVGNDTIIHKKMYNPGTFAKRSITVEHIL